MKRPLTLLPIILLFCYCCSCQKNDVINTSVCPLDSAHLPGKYKIESIKVLLPFGVENDVTQRFDLCALDDTMDLLIGKTYHNIDIGTAATCNNDYYGTWGINEANVLSIDSAKYPIVGYNCTTIILSKDSSGFTFKFYYKRV